MVGKTIVDWIWNDCTGLPSAKKSFSSSVCHTWAGLHPPRHRRASLESGVAICSEGPPRPLTCETPFHKIWPISDDFYFCFCSNRWFWTYLFRQGISLWERFSPQEISRGGASRWGRPTKLLWSGTPKKTQTHKNFGSGDPPPPLYIAFNGEAFTKLKGAPLTDKIAKEAFGGHPFFTWSTHITTNRIWRFLVRHGESEWNQQNRFCGWFDANLSETGIKVVTKAIRMMMVVKVVIRFLLRLSE